MVGAVGVCASRRTRFTSYVKQRCVVSVRDSAPTPERNNAAAKGTGRESILRRWCSPQFSLFNMGKCNRGHASRAISIFAHEEKIPTYCASGGFTLPVLVSCPAPWSSFVIPTLAKNTQNRPGSAHVETLTLSCSRGFYCMLRCSVRGRVCP